MDVSFAVFFAGTAAAYLPIYYGLAWSSELLRRSPISMPPRLTRRGEFIDSLRREAIVRATDLLMEAAHRARADAGQGLGVSSQLITARELMEPLFSRATIAELDRIAAAILAGDISRKQHILSCIERLKRRVPGAAPPIRPVA